MKHISATAAVLFYLILTVLWVTKSTTARLDCLEDTELDTEFCKFYDQHKEQENTDSICPTLRHLNTEFCSTESATSTLTATLTAISTAERDITNTQNLSTQTPSQTTSKSRPGVDSEETTTAETTIDDSYTEPLRDDCNGTKVGSSELSFGVHIVAILGATIGVLFVALIAVTVALVWTCKRKKKPTQGKWSINFQNSSLETTDTYQESLSQDTLSSPPQLHPSFYLTGDYSTLGLPIPSYKIPLTRSQPIRENEEHTYDTITRDSGDGLDHSPVVRRHPRTGANGHIIGEGEWGNNITRVPIHHEYDRSDRSQHFMNEHFDALEDEFGHFSDDNSQQAYNLLESIQEEPEDIDSDDNQDGVHDLESNEHAYQVLERRENGCNQTANHEGQPHSNHTHEPGDPSERSKLNSEERRAGEVAGEAGEGTHTPEQYETPVHSKINGSESKESNDVEECATEGPHRSKLNIHVHVSACTH